jgi:hypothetical protein
VLRTRRQKFEATGLGVGVETAELGELDCIEDKAVEMLTCIDDRAVRVEESMETAGGSLEADTVDEAPTVTETEEVILRPGETPIKELADDGAPSDELAVVEGGIDDELATSEDEATDGELAIVEEGTDDELATLGVRETLDELLEMEDSEDDGTLDVSCGVGEADEDALSHRPNGV